jgi:hypothetical protein
MTSFELVSIPKELILDIDINLVYLHLLDKFQYSFITVPNILCSNCNRDTNRGLPIPIKLKNSKIICKDIACGFICLVEYLKKQKQHGNMENIYSFNILWTILHFYLFCEDKILQ